VKHTRRCVQRLRPQALQNLQDSPKRGGLHSSGAVAAEYVYDPYGGIAEESGPLAAVFTFGFSTKLIDRETGLVSYQRRFYRPAIGRWINRDPIEEEGGDNLYAFCQNAPSLRMDYLGLRLSDDGSMLGISFGIPVGGDMFGMDWPSQNQSPFFLPPSDNRPNRRIDEFLDRPDFAELEKQLTAELVALCPDKPTRGTGIYRSSCCEPEKCRAEATAIASAYIAALEEAYHRRPWYVPGGMLGNLVIQMTNLGSVCQDYDPGTVYPSDVDIGLVCGGWANLGTSVLHELLVHSSCWKEGYQFSSTSRHVWAIVIQTSSGQSIDLDPWESGGTDYHRP
jgi:RHS repeat-associated protein